MIKYVLILAFCAWQTTHGLYFHIAETERKCFIEEIPDETTVMSKYRRNPGGHVNTYSPPLPPFSILQSTTK